MNIFKCKNGTFKVESVREFINFNTGSISKCIDVYANSQESSFDDIASILTDPIITEFEIATEGGVVLDTFKDVRIQGINKDIGSSVSVNISFIRE